MRRFVACAMAALLVTTTITPGPALARTADLPSGAPAGCSADTGQRPDAAAKWKEEAQRIPLGKKVRDQNGIRRDVERRTWQSRRHERHGGTEQRGLGATR